MYRAQTSIIAAKGPDLLSRPTSKAAVAEVADQRGDRLIDLLRHRGMAVVALVTVLDQQRTNARLEELDRAIVGTYRGTVRYQHAHHDHESRDPPSCLSLLTLLAARRPPSSPQSQQGQISATTVYVSGRRTQRDSK